MMVKSRGSILGSVGLIFFLIFSFPTPSPHPARPNFQSVLQAQFVPTMNFFDRSKNPDRVATTLEILLLLTILTLAPAIILLMTAFTRIVIVLSFVRRAIAVQELPPNQVLISLALILTFLVMSPVFIKIKDRAVLPYLDHKINQKTAFYEALLPLREFMFKQTRRQDMLLMMGAAQIPLTPSLRREQIPTQVLIPAFVLSELRRAFIMGFLIFIPFVIIDLVVSSVLISMGMLVLPPVLISLPLKIFLFILVDGWHLIVGSLITSFNM